jgi:phospholipid/cholesterol/gamma-HCH transport system substrate-binding protein
VNRKKGDSVPKNKRKTEIIAGVFALASLALLLFMVVFVGRHENIFEKRYQITGLFKSAGGLQTGADVRLAGISVGYVTDIEFGPQKKVKVEMKISRREQQRIRTDSVATIKTMGLMGDRYIEITVGSRNEPVIPTAGVIQTSEPFELTDLADIAEPVLKDIAKITHNVLAFTDKLVARSNEMDTLLDNMTDLSDSLQQGKGTIGALLKSDALYRKLSEILDTAQVTLKNLEAVSRNADKASVQLPALLNEARLSVRHFNRFTEKADRAASDALSIMNSGRAVAQDIKMIVSNLKQVSEDMKDAGPRLSPLLESAQRGISEGRALLQTVEHSWLLGGSQEREHKEYPIAVEGRDITEPQEIK